MRAEIILHWVQKWFWDPMEYDFCTHALCFLSSRPPILVLAPYVLFSPGTLVTGFNFRYPESKIAIPTLLHQWHEDTLATSKHMNTIGGNVWIHY